MKVKVLKVNNNELFRAFQAVPFMVYGERNIPASVNMVNNCFSQFNPVLEHIRYANFVAFEEDKPVGRITASVDNLNPRQEEGFWGGFECVDSPEIAKELLDSAADWLKKQSKTVMIGPATLNTNQLVGIMIEGFEYKPPVELPYNPPYYQDLVEKGGLNKIHDLACYNWRLPETTPRAFDRVRPLKSSVIRPVNYGAIPREAILFQEFHNKTMSENWGFIPYTLNDALGGLSDLSSRVPPNLFLICEVNKKLAGMLLSIPYQMPRRDGTGGLIRHAIGGVLPEFRYKGLHILLLKESYKQCKRFGFTEGEGSQIAESNDKIKRNVINPIFGGEVIKLYHIYQQNLA